MYCQSLKLHPVGLLQIRCEAANIRRRKNLTPEPALESFLNVTKDILSAEYMMALLVDTEHQVLRRHVHSEHLDNLDGRTDVSVVNEGGNACSCFDSH